MCCHFTVVGKKCKSIVKEAFNLFPERRYLFVCVYIKVDVGFELTNYLGAPAKTVATRPWQWSAVTPEDRACILFSWPGTR